SFEIEEGIHKTWQQKYIREDRRGGRESDRSYFYTRWKSKQSGKIEKKTYSMKKSKGGRGGDAGDGRSVELKIATGEFNYLLNNIVNDEGVVGIGGEAGECGKGENKDYIGENGKEGKIL